MLLNLRNKKAQTIMGEYLLVFFLIVGVATAMTVYFRRAVQARMRDARETMVDIVRARTINILVNGNASYAGPIYREYEPYYTNTVSDSNRNSFSREDIEPGASTGIYTIAVDEFRTGKGLSNVTPPKDADKLDPWVIQR